MSHFYSILRLCGDDAARRKARDQVQGTLPNSRIDETPKGDLCIDLSRERNDWPRHQQEIAAGLNHLKPVLETIKGCSGVVDSAINLTPSSNQVLEVLSFRVDRELIRLLDQLRLDYEFSIYLSRE